MSCNFELWSVRPLDLDKALPEGLREGDIWVININPPDGVLQEDIPAGISKELAGIEYLTTIDLEGDVPDDIDDYLQCIMPKLAKASQGVVWDLQTDTLYTPSGVKPYKTIPRSNKELTILKFSWWFTDSPLLKHEGLDNLLETLKRTLPEALPRRYGLHGPPSYTLLETGEEHFRKFLHKHGIGGLGIIWYPNRPVLAFSLSVRPDWGETRLGFRANRLTISLDSSVLEQPEWHTRLQTFWRELSKTIKPFYGDVRRLRNYVWNGTTLLISNESEEHPICSIWWKGIPSQHGLSVVMGGSLIKHWEDSGEPGERDADLVFINYEGWI